MAKSSLGSAAGILAYDTSTDVLSIAVLSKGKIISEVNSSSFLRHSDRLLPVLQKELRRCRVDIKNIDAIAVGLGPGSFTGLRVGVTVAKLLAYSLGKKLVGVSGFEAMAQELAPRKGMVALMMDARKSMVYAAIYERTGTGAKAVLKPCLMTRDEFLERSKTADKVFETLKHPKASQIARIALRRLSQGQTSDPLTLEPQYIHPRDCNARPE